jgi:hypothetical protein
MTRIRTDNADEEGEEKHKSISTLLNYGHTSNIGSCKIITIHPLYFIFSNSIYCQVMLDHILSQSFAVYKDDFILNPGNIILRLLGESRSSNKNSFMSPLLLKRADKLLYVWPPDRIVIPSSIFYSLLFMSPCFIFHFRPLRLFRELNVLPRRKSTACFVPCATGQPVIFTF